MLISVLANGDIRSILPENFYQGNSEANTIYVVAPFSANTQVTITFDILATGQRTEPYLFNNPTVVSNELNVWKINIDKPLTQFYGEVNYEVKFYTGTQEIATSKGRFKVLEADDFVLPEKPDNETYIQILSKLSDIQANFINGWLEARALQIYNSEFSYSLNSFVFGEQDGKVYLFRSLREINLGNDLTDTESWQKIDLSSDTNAIFEEINKIVSGETVVGKAERDASGNKFEDRYINKTNIVTGWSAEPSNDNVPSEKLVKDAITGIVAGSSGGNVDLVFDTYAQFQSWLSGTYTRPDGKTTADLTIGTGILIKEENTSDYWCSSLETPFTINNFTPFEVSINLDNYLAKDNIDAYTPTSSYNPATKKYVDDAVKTYVDNLVGDIDTVLTVLNSGSGV